MNEENESIDNENSSYYQDLTEFMKEFNLSSMSEESRRLLLGFEYQTRLVSSRVIMSAYMLGYYEGLKRDMPSETEEQFSEAFMDFINELDIDDLGDLSGKN
jgi:hypothetical protein